MLMNKKSSFFLAIIFIFFPLFAHGTKYEIIPEKAIGIKAMYDTGEPMANAKVLIFAPDETKVTQTTESDSNGVFYLTPDRAGTWTMQVRDRGGHGMRINLPVDESMRPGTAQKSSGMTFIQKVIAALCVVWGCIGTALYFKVRVHR
jgi:nickel transport protein